MYGSKSSRRLTAPALQLSPHFSHLTPFHPAHTNTTENMDDASFALISPIALDTSASSACSPMAQALPVPALNSELLVACALEDPSDVNIQMCIQLLRWQCREKSGHEELFGPPLKRSCMWVCLPFGLQFWLWCAALHVILPVGSFALSLICSW